MDKVRDAGSSPSLKLLYMKAAAAALTKGSRWPDETLVRDGIGIELAQVAAYNRVCGFALTDHLPLTYPHLLAFPLAVQLMAQPDFPLPLPGLVHIRNTITQHRPIDAGETLTVRVRLAELRPHPKGRAFDIVSVVEAGDGERVWESTSTNLKRGKGDGAGDPGPSLERDDLGDTARWRVGKDTGRRYASVSGDVNPIHLHPLTARLFGFPKPIAHGMWTKARAVAALAGRLPGACTVDVGFRKPLLMPSTVAFATRETGDGWAFAVRSRGGSVHLHGQVTGAGA